ncbi:MAG: response regulator, partial [Labilithrix sp.]|nr:response regulator [Labilithrix sp.]
CDGEEALAKIAKQPPDVVIMDLSMPKLDGWEATRLIKSNPRTTHVLVVVVTGNTTPANLEAARAAGADEVCAKPCLPRDLLDCVRRRLDTRPPRSR